MTLFSLALLGAILFFFGMSLVQVFTDVNDKRAPRNVGIAFILCFILFLTT